MEDSNYQWSTLLRKYRRKEKLNEEESKELQRFINTCPVKMRQFKQWTDRQEFAKQLRDYDNDRINTEGAWERLVTAYPSVVTPEKIPFLKSPAVRRLVLESLAIAGIVAIVYFLITSLTKDPDELTAAILQPVIKDYSYVKNESGGEYNLETAATGSPFKSQLVYQHNTLGIAADQKHSNHNALFDVITAPHKQMQVRLADGSLVKVSSLSALRFPLRFAENERRVQLSGKAFFNVVTNKPVPFKVRLTNGLEVEATGTTFNITSDENGRTIVTLLTGTVNMVYGNQKIVVKQGQQVEFTKEKKFRVIERPDCEQAVEWAKSEFNFYNKDIKDVLREVGRFYQYKVIFKDSLPTMLSGGTFQTQNNLQSIIKAIENLNDVDIQPEGDTLIVTRRR